MPECKLELFNAFRYNEVLKLAEEAYTDYSTFNTLWDEKKAREYLDQALVNQNEYMVTVLLIDQNNKTRGFIVGSVVFDPFGQQKAVVENHWYIQEEYRNYKNASLMLSALEFYANKVGAQKIMTSSSYVDLEKFYKRKGYHKVITMYQKGLN